MFSNTLSLVLISTLGFSVFAQDLIQFKNREISLEEFESTYAFNLQHEGLEKTLKNFLDYELLYQDALDTKVDTIRSFKRNVAKGRREATIRFLIKNDVTQNYLQEKFNRERKNRKVQFISIPFFDKKTKSNALKSIQRLSEEIKNKSNSFAEILANQPNEVFGSNAFFVSGLQESEEFENYFFKIDINKFGDIQEISNNAYIFGKVLSEEDLNVRKEIYAILINANQKDAKNQIDLAYQELKDSVTFEKVLRKYTNNQLLLKQEGKLNVIGTNYPKPFQIINSKIKENEYSEPFLFNGFWQIIKYKNKTLCAKETPDCYLQFEEQVLKSNHFQLVDDNIYENLIPSALKQKVKIDTVYLNQLLASIPNSYYENGDSVFWEEKPILSFEGESPFYAKYFSPTLNRLKPQFRNPFNIKKIITQQILQIKKKLVLTNFKNHLTDYNKEFRKTEKERVRSEYFSTYNHFRLNLVASQDFEGQKKFYESHKENYKVENVIKGTIYTCLNLKHQIEIAKKLTQGESKDSILMQYKNLLDEKKRPVVVAHTGKFLHTDPRIPKKIRSKRVQIYTKKDKFYVLELEKKIKSQYLSFDEVNTKLITEYKEAFFNKTLIRLRTEKQYQWNQESLNALKKKYE